MVRRWIWQAELRQDLMEIAQGTFLRGFGGINHNTPGTGRQLSVLLQERN